MRNTGFNYVDVTGEAHAGYINLFYGEDVVALVPPDIASQIKKEIPKRYYESKSEQLSGGRS